MEQREQVMETTQSPLQTLYRSHPHAFFLIDSVMHRASDKNWESLLEPVTIADPARLDQMIRREVLRADQRRLGEVVGNLEFSKRYPQQHTFRLYGYKEVHANVTPTTFVCRKCNTVKSLQKQLETDKLQTTDLICTTCNIPLKQIIHVFGHPSCGSIAEIMPQRCKECKQSMRLVIDNVAFGRSAWFCSSGHTAKLEMACPACLAIGMSFSDARMIPYASGAAIRSIFMTVVDINTATNWEEVAQQRLSIQQETIRQMILDYYKNDPIALPAVTQRLNAGEEVRRQMYDEFLQMNPDLKNRPDALRQAIGGEPGYDIQDLLAEYAGTQAVTVPPQSDPLDPALSSIICKRFHIRPRYITNLPVLQIVYGYQVGSSDPKKAKLRTFDRGRESVALVHRGQTEAALFDLHPNALAAWISKKLGVTVTVRTLQAMLIRPEISPQGDEAYALVEALLHTLAHLLIRQSELYTGLSRESLSELIFPPAMAFAVVCAEGSELGALRSAFASPRIFDWLNRALSASRECANDTSCVEGKITGAAACHACLFINERRCNGFWNQNLDRRLVSDVRNQDGFWD